MRFGLRFGLGLELGLGRGSGSGCGFGLRGGRPSFCRCPVTMQVTAPSSELEIELRSAKPSTTNRAWVG